MKKVWLQEEHIANNKIGMGLVISHTYNLSHAYLSHTPHCKAPYISGLIEGDRVARYRYRLKTRCIVEPYT